MFVFAAKVNIRGSDLSDPADCGGVNVKASAVLGSASWKLGKIGVRLLGNAELGVSG
jgi:hypothetical protein